MFQIAFLALFFILPVFGQVSPKPEPISDEKFVAEIKAACEVAHKHNTAVEFLGSGTANLLATNRPSKTKCGVGNPNPKEGECHGLYPIYPDRKPLSKVIASEQKHRAKATVTPTVWAAWKDCDGTFVIAFNSPEMGSYELSTVHEVEGGWNSIRIYQLSIKCGENMWQRCCRINYAGLTKLQLGQGGGVKERLKALEEIGVISNAEIKEATTVASK